MTADEDQLSGWMEKKLQNTSPDLKLHPNSVWWSVAHLIRYSFLNPDETVTSEQYAHQINTAPKTAMPAVTIVQQGPILHDNA